MSVIIRQTEVSSYRYRQITRIFYRQLLFLEKMIYHELLNTIPRSHPQSSNYQYELKRRESNTHYHLKH